jgi:hypothetical protein
LTRVHRLPIFCIRCLKTFATKEDLDAHLMHLMADPLCDVRPRQELPEGVTDEQFKKLRKRLSNRTEHGKWKYVYQILFPEDDRFSVPSPCASLLLRCKNTLTKRRQIMQTTRRPTTTVWLSTKHIFARILFHAQKAAPRT